MHPNDYYLDALDRQAATIHSALLDLEDSRRANWRVLEAELTLGSVIRAYLRLLDDAPDLAVRFHVKHMNGI